MNILVTGGCGYIGSHTCLELYQAGYQPIIIDNLSNSKTAVLEQIKSISGQLPLFYHGDIRDKVLLQHLFEQHDIQGVIHFAGLKAVGESVKKPLEYYENNVYGTLALATIMQQFSINNIIFSSSATVYGEQTTVPYIETMNPGIPTSPYGKSKLMVEQCLTDLHHAHPQWSVCLLRYFNPVGAHPSGLMGEDPLGIPNNLMPYICQVAIGRREKLFVFGNDYPTLDGTGVRDYLHVMDLAKGHVCALKKCLNEPGTHIYNLGTGQPHSVLDVINTFKEVNQCDIPYEITARRDGDIAAFWADATKANNELDWQAEHNLQQMCRDSWYWQKNNPQGYKE